MSQTNAISAQGTIVARSIDPNWPDNDPVGGAVSFVDIAELKDITPPALTRNTIETTSHNQDADRYIVGIKRHGEMSLSLNFLPGNATHDHLTGLQKSWDDGDRDIFRITYPDGSAWIFSGFVSNFAPSAPIDEALVADVTIRPTGNHIFVAAS